jgi:hypothetical protein
MTARILALTLILLGVLVPEARAEAGWRWPVSGEVATPYRNGADPYAGGQHRGIDIAAPVGSRVVAATSGTVTFSGTVGASGLTVSIRTADGRFDTSYLHLGSAAVGRGEHVSAGDPIGTLGTSDRRSIATPHLHFGVREAGQRHAYRDPLPFLPPPGAPEPRAPRAVPIAAPQPAPRVPAPAPVAGSPPPFRARHPAPAPASGPSLAREPAPALVQVSALDPVAARAPDGPGLPSLGESPSVSSGLERAGGQERITSHGAAAPSRGRIDRGWLAACLALVAAAGLLARPAGVATGLRGGRALALRARTGATRATTAAAAPDR